MTRNEAGICGLTGMECSKVVVTEALFAEPESKVETVPVNGRVFRTLGNVGIVTCDGGTCIFQRHISTINT